MHFPAIKAQSQNIATPKLNNWQREDRQVLTQTLAFATINLILHLHLNLHTSVVFIEENTSCYGNS